MPRVAPFCAACAWDRQKGVGRAKNKVDVCGMVDTASGYKVYEAKLDLCEMHKFLWDMDGWLGNWVGFRMEMTARVGMEVAGDR